MILRYLLCILLPLPGMAQWNKADIEKRFNTYINFKGSLNNSVSITDEGVSILSAGKPEFTVYANEYSLLQSILTTYNYDEQVKFYNWKKTQHLNRKQLDSLGFIVNAGLKPGVSNTNPNLPLAGIRIAIDPGHIAGNRDMAHIEQKFLDFGPNAANTLKDSIHIAEGILTYNTAAILKNKLTAKGAQVFVTRPQQNFSAFQVTYDTWYKQRRKKTLDSLVKAGSMTEARHKQLMKLDQRKFFWEFFRDYELIERSRIINAYKPDLTIVIHYNVDEKNTDWLNPSNKNYTMTFIGGGMTNDNLSKPANKMHLLRLLLTDQLQRSEKISSITVQQFSKQLNIPLAKQTDADYLRDNCLKTPSAGVFCRNLALCRLINSPLVYGECLYQDDVDECQKLTISDYDVEGLKVPKRVYEVANCYYDAIIEYFRSK
ncbi:MAG: N-acetylmuramoyl-L-alanine amidase [Bacteroidetes bacterium]|nr:N-acetylmuramoyl-L-alanine amidase [Bacteroidota bacterium]